MMMIISDCAVRTENIISIDIYQNPVYINWLLSISLKEENSGYKIIEKFNTLKKAQNRLKQLCDIINKELKGE